jgi:hypothetical protein
MAAELGGGGGVGEAREEGGRVGLPSWSWCSLSRGRPLPPLAHISPPPLSHSLSPRAPRSDARPHTHTRTHTMPPKPKAKNNARGAGAPAARPLRLPVSGLEVGLLDVGRFVALNGYAHECRLLPFLSRAFRREEDFLVACKHVRYGGKGRTRLMSLAQLGDVERVSFLLKVGAEVEARNVDGMTPLHCASATGREAVVRLLLDRGAEVRAATSKGVTPLHVASQYGHAAVVRLLLERGADVRAALPDGFTPLHSASLEGHEPVVRLLLDGGADANARDEEGRTALAVAGKAGHKDIVRLLVEAVRR